MNDFSGTWCLTNAPNQNGDLWVKVTKGQKVKIMNPAGNYWRGRVFATVEEFRKVYKEAKCKRSLK